MRKTCVAYRYKLEVDLFCGSDHVRDKKWPHCPYALHCCTDRPATLVPLLPRCPDALVYPGIYFSLPTSLSQQAHIWTHKPSKITPQDTFGALLLKMSISSIYLKFSPSIYLPRHCTQILCLILMNKYMLYGCHLSILLSPLKNRTPQNLTIAKFGNQFLNLG